METREHNGLDWAWIDGECGAWRVVSTASEVLALSSSPSRGLGARRSLDFSPPGDEHQYEVPDTYPGLLIVPDILAAFRCIARLGW